MGTSASVQVDKDFTEHAQTLGGYITDAIAADLADHAGDSEQDRLASQQFVRGLVTSDKTLKSIRVFQRAQGRDSLYVNAGGQSGDMPTAHDLQLVASGTPSQEHSSIAGVPTLESLKPIWIGGHVWGSVEIDYSLAGRVTSLGEIWRDIAGVTLLGLITELVLFWLLLRTVVLRRLHRLATVATRVATLWPDPKALEPQVSATRDELAVLSSQVDEVLRKIGRRARQDQVIVDLSLQAARVADLDELMVAAGAAVGQVVPQNELVFAELVGDPSDPSVAFSLSHPNVSAQPRSRLSDLATLQFIAATGEDVFYREGVAEDRFDTTSFVTQGVRSGFGVLVPGDSRPFGVLAAYSSDADAFEAGDLGFIKSLAMLLGATATRLHADRDRLAGEERLQATFLTSPAGIIFIDHRNGKILEANPAFCESVGYDAGELRGLSVVDIVHPDDLDWAVSQIASAATAGVSNVDSPPGDARFEQRFNTKDGRTVWMQLSASLVRDSEGEPRYFQSICIDVTERKAAETTLQRTLSLLRKTGEDRQRLMTSLVQAQREQSKDASNLHEHVTQVLVGSALELDRLATVTADPESARRIELTRLAVSGAITELRDATDRRRGGRQNLPAVRFVKVHA
jgi:PAS domain S-box-containing protein